MKLLSPTQTQERKAQETTRDIFRINELNKSADEARKRLALAEADFQQMLVGQRARWAREEKEHDARCQEMKSEIVELEKLLAVANVPIEELKKESVGKLDGVGKILFHLEESENRAEELSNTLQDKLDELGQRESDILRKEERMALIDAQLVKRSQDIQNKNAELSQSLSQALADRAIKDKELEEKKKALFLREQSLVAKEETYKRTEDRLAQWEAKLKDERGILDRMYIRIGQEKK